jgi:hypothetical protein
VAVCKEIEKEDDDTLGIGEFADKYWEGNPLYQDKDRAFFTFLGNKKLSIPLKSLLNPIRAYRELKALGARMKERGLEGNLKGEGLVKGGVLVVGPDDTVLYTHFEETGSGIPKEALAEIKAAALKLIAPPA